MENKNKRVAASFDLECGIALVCEEDMDWLAGCKDVTAHKDGALEIGMGKERRAFDVIPVSASVVAKSKPREGSRRRWRHATCGGGEPAQHIPCFKLSSGRYAKVELAGYSECIRGDRDEFCDEEYVKIGDIIIAWDSDCELVAQRHPQYRWLCLPSA